MPRALTIRQGGDELLVIGAPDTAGTLEPALRTFMAGWLDAVDQLGFPRDSVLPRILLASGRARELREMRGRLGNAIGALKKVAAAPAAPGVIAWL